MERESDQVEDGSADAGAGEGREDELTFDTKLGKDFDPETDPPVFLFLGNAEGAYPIGAQVVKRASEAEDFVRDGWKGTVVSSLDARKVYEEVKADNPDMPKVDYFYWVLWDGADFPIGILDYKIARIDG